MRALWTSPQTSPLRREEALWEYWSHVAAAADAIADEDLEALFAYDAPGVGNALGELLIRDRLSPSLFANVRNCLERVDSPDCPWAMRQLAAREAVNELKAHASVDRRPQIEALVQKGTSWAALSSVASLSVDEMVALERRSESMKVFTKGQRAQLREAIAAEKRRRKVG